MSVRSFIVYVESGARESVAGLLRATPTCEVYPAENRDVLVVVSAVSDREAEDAFDDRLAATPGVLNVALVAGYQTAEPGLNR